MKHTNKITALMGVILVSSFANIVEATPREEVEDSFNVLEPAIIQNDIIPVERRLNALRTDPSEAGVWARGGAGNSKIREYEYDFSIASTGYDIHKENEARHLFLGLGVSYSKNKCDDRFLGEAKNLGFNIYGSWLGKENKDYVDVIFKYGKLDKDYAVENYDRTTYINYEETKNYKKSVMNFAVKYGRRYEKEDGWYYEPSVGLSYGHVGSKNYTVDYDRSVYAEAIKSTIGSLGIQVGKNIQGIEYFGRFEVNHDFDGMITLIDTYGYKTEEDMGGTWYRVAIGASKKINNNSSFYLDVEKDFGNKVKKPYAVCAGYRYTW